MMQPLRRARALALAAVCLASASCAGAAGSSSSGSTAQDFSLPTLDGKTARLSDHAGKVVLIDFWSTTCDPCLAEMPHLVDLYKKHKDKGFVVLAVSLDGPESRAQVSSVAHDKEMIFPVLLDEETKVTARFNPKRELPFSVLVGKNGAIIRKRGGYQPGDEKALEEEIEKALAAQ
ncbi:MAG: TlpA family protein disulfide reductase [Polyangiaceae bacterium]|nr:TlpA family protein disulfide reductase [Polyangiaceae bacterium]